MRNKLETNRNKYEKFSLVNQEKAAENSVYVLIYLWVVLIYLDIAKLMKSKG